MKILVTGSAGFIGSALTLRLLARGDSVIGIDNHNNYYDPELKERRLARHINHPNYKHYRIDLVDSKSIMDCFSSNLPQRVVNLAAQAGVRYSIENPMAYIDSNIIGFVNVLEGCRHYDVEHLVYASSSSVYGSNTNIPFALHEGANHPLSLYAATKKSNEVMAHSYSSLFGLSTTGLRFFTVYGPWGRPDMALFKFTRSILTREPIQIYNYGNHRRDFTYIDDIVEAMVRIIDSPAEANPLWNGALPDPATSSAPWRIYNIGNDNPTQLMDYVEALESALGMSSIKEMLPLQAGDVPETHADVSDLISQFGFKPATSVNNGIAKFVDWYRNYYRM